MKDLTTAEWRKLAIKFANMDWTEGYLPSLKKACREYFKLRTSKAEAELASGTWIKADDVKRMAKELDDALNGPSAAQAPALCDVVQQLLPILRGLEAMTVPQWRKVGTGPWWDGHPDWSDGGGPYQTRNLYSAPLVPEQEHAATWHETLSQKKQDDAWVNGFNACRMQTLALQGEADTVTYSPAQLLDRWCNLPAAREDVLWHLMREVAGTKTPEQDMGLLNAVGLLLNRLTGGATPPVAVVAKTACDPVKKLPLGTKLYTKPQSVGVLVRKHWELVYSQALNSWNVFRVETPQGEKTLLGTGATAEEALIAATAKEG